MLDVEYENVTYSMPSVVLGNVYAAVYSDLDYDEVINYPNTFMSDATAFDILSVQYGGENEMIHYDITTHNVSVSSSVLIVYYMD